MQVSIATTINYLTTAIYKPMLDLISYNCCFYENLIRFPVSDIYIFVGGRPRP